MCFMRLPLSDIDRLYPHAIARTAVFSGIHSEGIKAVWRDIVCARWPWLARRDNAPCCIPKGDVQLHTGRFAASINEFADNSRKLAA
jgi:hypothetical protein